MMGELHASRDAERLSKHFGGDAAWQNMARQIKTWGQANRRTCLPDPGRELRRRARDASMMQAREPAVLQDANGPQHEIDETTSPVDA